MNLRNYWRWMLALVSSFSLVMGSQIPVAAQSSHVPAGHARVIASGVDLLPRVDIAWRVTGGAAQPGDTASYFDRTLGFVVATGAPILITDSASGHSTLVDIGQASFQPQNANQRRASVSSQPTTYLGIDLLIAEDVDSEATLGSAQLLYAGDAFRIRRGSYDIRLTSDTLAPRESGGFLATSNAPTLFVVLDGAVQISANDRVTELYTGDIAEFTGDFAILAGANSGATWIAASIGEKVEIPASSTSSDRGGNIPTQRDPESDSDADQNPTQTDRGSLSVTLYDCPAGSDPSIDTSPCEYRLADPWNVTIEILHMEDSGVWNLVPDASPTTPGTWVFTNLPAYTGWFYPDPDSIGGDIYIGGDAYWGDDGYWHIDMQANSEIHVDVYRVAPV